MKILITLSVVLFAGCPLQKSVNYSGPGASSQPTSSSAPTTSSSPDASSPPASEDPRVGTAEWHAEQGQSNLDKANFLRREFEALRGMKVADAKAKAKAFGHTGEIRMEEEDRFVEGCEPGIVCRASDERGGESGMSNDNTLLLWTNKSLTISGPRSEPMTREAIITVRDPSVAGFSDLLERIAQSGAPVLIQGETGVGKEVLARSLHAVSQRPGDLVVVHCAALSASQLERELFGADEKPGAFETNGTVLLDEIGEMPRELQDQLVRALEHRQVFRLHGDAPRAFGARLIASHRTLPEGATSLRSELLQRLHGITLELLPLRERPSEIVGLAQELLVEVVRETAFPTTRFTASALTTLMQYDWPGNVRELRHVVSRAALLAGASPIESHHLLLDIRSSKPDVLPLAPREDFLSVAREHRGNASAIARALHTSRSQVRRLASRFSVDLDQLRRATRD